jgi:hypothetical protein
MARDADPISQALVIVYTYNNAIAGGVIVADDAALRDIDEAVQRAADDIALGFALYAKANGSLLMVTKKIAELDVSDLERVARYKSTHTQWDVHVSGPLQAIRHLPNETQLTIGVAVVSISREYRQDETVVFDR